jgi:hypothetical protein
MVRAYAAAIELDPEEILHDILAVFPEDPGRGVPAANPEPQPEDVRTAIARRAARIRERLRKREVPTPSAWPGLSRKSFRAIGVPVALVLVGYVAGAGELSVKPAARMADTLRTVVGVPALVRTSPPLASVTANTRSVDEPATPRSKVSHVSHSALDAATSGLRSTPTRPAADASPLSRVGELVITSNPSGARVTVNGVGWGWTPVTIRHLPPGEKRIRLSKDGYATAERAIQLTPDRPVQSVQIGLRAH